MTGSESGRVLLVDDDRSILRSFESVLTRQGWSVETALDGLEAKTLVERHSFDVILCDVHMPGYGGLAFLRAVRERDVDVPVVLITGAPSVDSSIRAIEHGVFRYLVKPVANGTLIDVVTRAARLHALARLKRRALAIAGTDVQWMDDRTAVEARFERARLGLWVAFQPIISWLDRRAFGYEALLRTDEPAFANPQDFLAAAERLGKLSELGGIVRAKVAEAARQLPGDVRLFVNLHASDLDDKALTESHAPLSGIAHRVVLEVTERASLESVRSVGSRIAALKGMGFRIAIDDLGAGYAGLTSFTLLEPEVAKLDMSLVRGIDADPTKQAIVKAMKRLCDELGIMVVAEGVETPAERDTLAEELGFDLLQGYLFGKPQRGFGTPVW